MENISITFKYIMEEEAISFWKIKIKICIIKNDKIFYIELTLISLYYTNISLFSINIIKS